MTFQCFIWIRVIFFFTMTLKTNFEEFFISFFGNRKINFQPPPLTGCLLQDMQNTKIEKKVSHKTCQLPPTHARYIQLEVPKCKYDLHKYLSFKVGGRREYVLLASQISGKKSNHKSNLDIYISSMGGGSWQVLWLTFFSIFVAHNHNVIILQQHSGF